MKETEMFEPVKTLLLEQLGCSQVYGEVSNFDVLGLLGTANVIVEMKTTLNFKVIEQAFNARYQGHYVYIAVPEVKSVNHHFITYDILKPNNIGLIYVRKNGSSRKVWEKYHDEPYPEYTAWLQTSAKFNSMARKNHYSGDLKKYSLRAKIKSWSSQNIGGSKGGNTITAYSFTMGKVKDFLKENGWSTVQEIIDNVPEVTEHYARPKPSLVATLNQEWNEHWVQRRRHPEKREWQYRYRSESLETEESS